jgi:hypothetical protein
MNVPCNIQQLETQARRLLQEFETALASKHSPWISDVFSIEDIAVGSWMLRLENCGFTHLWDRGTVSVL